MDGCQECQRESLGDRVMSHDKRTCLEASTWRVQFLSSWWGQYVRWGYGCCYLCTGTVHLLRGVCCVFPHGHPLRLGPCRRRARALEFSASCQVRPGHRQHLSGASLLRPLAARLQGPATQLVPPGWASSSLTVLRRVPCHAPGVALLSRRCCSPVLVVRCLGVSLCRSSLRARPVVRVFPRLVADFSRLSSMWRSWGRWISRTSRFSGFHESLLIQARWGGRRRERGTNSCWSGYSSGSFYFVGALCVFSFLLGEKSTQSGIYNCIFSSRSATARSH